VIRAILLFMACAAASPAWVESVEFPWNAYPQQLWERELVWLKNIGIRHVSLPPAKDAAELADVIRIIRRLDIEADLEGPLPDSLQPLSKTHGGPLTEPLPGTLVRISALAPGAITRTRELLASGTAAIIWTDVEDTLGAAGYKAGAVNFAGDEKPAAIALRRSAQLSAYWNKTFPALQAVPGAAITRTESAGAAAAGPEVRQFAGENGVSVVSVVNKSAKAWKGDLRVLYPAAKRQFGVPGVSVAAHDAVWLPVNVPLTAGPLCKDCSAFANADHLVYATAELTAMEYENGILAMEFDAPVDGEVILQLSQEPSGPLVAGGKPSEFEWDEHTQRARLKIPAGKGAGNHVRIGLAIQPPDATAFFDNGRVLIIGEKNSLTAEFSSEAIAQRSRLRVTPAFPVSQEAGKEPLGLTYKVTVPANAVHGDHADLAIEADGMQMSHARPQLLKAATVRFPDAVDVHLAANTLLPVFPATVVVNQRAGRELTVNLRNNALEIRTFVLEPKAEGLEFSPAKLEVTVGVSTARDVSFRVFANRAMPGIHLGSLTVTGATSMMEPMQFAVIPLTGSVAWATEGFSFIESAKTRASFGQGRWLEYVNKENGQNLLPAGGVAFGGSVEGARLEDLELMVPKGKK
jgi:hypothetical protein